MSIRTCHKCGQQFIAEHRCPFDTSVGDSVIIGGVVAGISDSALLGTAAGTLLGGNLEGAIVGSIVGDILSGGGLFD